MIDEKKNNNMNDSVYVILVHDFSMSNVKSQLAEVDVKADKQVAKNWNQIKVAIITAICTLLATGVIGEVVSFIK